jgi:hypothetical protein
LPKSRRFLLTLSLSAQILAAITLPTVPPIALAQGVSPTQTYQRYLRAVENTKDFQDVKLFQTKKTRADYKELSPESAQMIKDSLPKNVRVLSEVVHGNTATLKVDGTLSLKAFAPQINAMGAAMQGLSKTPLKPVAMQTHATGTINLENEEGEWRISGGAWQGDDPNRPKPETPAGIAYDKAAAANARTTASAETWCTQAVSKPFPNKPAYGKILSVPFVTDDVYISEIDLSPTNKLSSLHLRKGTHNIPVDAEYIIALGGAIKSMPGKTFIVKPDTAFDASAHQPYVQYNVNLGSPQPSPVNCKSQIYPVDKHFGMRLTFSQMRGDKLPGYIVVHLPDKDQSFIEGYFYATVK